MSIGAALADARRQAGLTVSQVSQRTHIRESIIRGIEDDDYSACGGDFYTRGHIRAIAKVIGADAEPLIHEYDSEHMSAAAITAADAFEPITPVQPVERRSELSPSVVIGLAAAIGIILLVAVGLAVYHLVAGPSQPSGSDRDGPNAAGAPHQTPVAAHHPVARHSPTPPPSHSPSPSPSAAAVTLTPASATAFGVGGAGQGDNPQLAHKAIDGSPATAWHTDWYTTAAFGGLYSGTGLLLDLGRTETLTGARITLGPDVGTTFQVRVGSSPALSSLSPVATEAGVGGIVRVRLATGARGRYVLIWFTKLPSGPSGFQARIFDVRLAGHP